MFRIAVADEDFDEVENRVLRSIDEGARCGHLGRRAQHFYFRQSRIAKRRAEIALQRHQLDRNSSVSLCRRPSRRPAGHRSHRETYCRIYISARYRTSQRICAISGHHQPPSNVRINEIERDVSGSHLADARPDSEYRVNSHRTRVGTIKSHRIFHTVS